MALTFLPEKPTPKQSNKNSNWPDRLKGIASKVGTKATRLADDASEKMEQSPKGRAIKAAHNKAAAAVSEVFDGVSAATDKVLININGTEAQTHIVKLVEQQRRYNDILATRLAEALNRIDQLELQVKKLSNER